MALCPSCPSGCDVSVTATVTVQDPAAKTIIPESNIYTAEAGEVPAGKSTVNFYNTGSGIVQINGKDFPAGATIFWGSLGDGKTYPAISFSALLSTLRIDTTTLP